jgi:hypothetical protein
MLAIRKFPEQVLNYFSRRKAKNNLDFLGILIQIFNIFPYFSQNGKNIIAFCDGILHIQAHKRPSEDPTQETSPRKTEDARLVSKFSFLSVSSHLMISPVGLNQLYHYYLFHKIAGRRPAKVFRISRLHSALYEICH